MLEESFEQLDQEQCAAYLKRLKLPQEECTLEFLDRLIRRHLEEIPFENLDLVRTHELIWIRFIKKLFRAKEVATVLS